MIVGTLYGYIPWTLNQIKNDGAMSLNKDS